MAFWAGAHYPERATGIFSCNGVLTSRFIFRWGLMRRASLRQWLGQVLDHLLVLFLQKAELCTNLKGVQVPLLVLKFVFPTHLHSLSLFSTLSHSFVLFFTLSNFFPFFPTLSHFFSLFPTLSHSVSNYFPLFPTLPHSFSLFPLFPSLFQSFPFFPTLSYSISEFVLEKLPKYISNTIDNFTKITALSWGGHIQYAVFSLTGLIPFGQHQESRSLGRSNQGS